MTKIIKLRKVEKIPDRDLFELLNNNVIMSITDTLGRITVANAKFCAKFGYHEHELLGEINWLLKSECDKDPKYKELWKTIKKGETWNGILHHQDASNTVFWLETTITPILDYKGQVEKYASIHKDITLIQEERNSLTDLQFKHSAFIESIPSLVLSINRQGKILSANRGIGDLDANEVIDTYIFGYINPIFHEMVKEHIAYIFNGGKGRQFETIEYGPEGNKIFYLSQIGPRRNKEGDIISATISTRDITSLRKIKKERRDNDTKYQTIFKSINVGILVVADDKGNITEWNKGAELAFGYSEAEIIGSHLTQLISLQFRKASMKGLISAVKKLKTQRIQETIEMYGLKKNGTEFPVEFGLSKWKKGKNTYFCAMMLDISKSKALEHRLKAKSRDLELFMYRSAHDLKAPFSTAEGIIDLINQEATNTNIYGLTEMLDATLQKGKLIIDNLTLAAIVLDSNKETQTINFANLISEVIDELASMPHSSSIKYNMTVMVNEELQFNRNILKSLLQQLIQNAIKFSKPLQANFQPHINIEITSVANNIQLIVRDNGKGISREHESKVFDLFYKGDNEELQGSGLGLYLVRNIVEDLNGEIEMTTELAKGTCFKILLPHAINSA